VEIKELSGFPMVRAPILAVSVGKAVAKTTTTGTVDVVMD